MAAVEFQNVGISFGSVPVVKDLSLTVNDGEFVFLLGPSGCGKTTTLRMIGGFEEPSSGLIELQGEDVTWLPPSSDGGLPVSSYVVRAVDPTTRTELSRTTATPLGLVPACHVPA